MALSATPTHYQNSKNNYTETQAIDLTKGYEKLPAALVDFISKIGPVVHENVPTFSTEFKPIHITQYTYHLDGKLDGHVDNIKYETDFNFNDLINYLFYSGWVVILSFGCTAKFWLQLDKNSDKKIGTWEAP